MKWLVILAVAALGIGGIIWLTSAGSAEPAPSPAAPSVGIVDAMSVQLDARVKGTLTPRLLATRNELQQVLASRPVDGEAADATLARCDTLADDVRRGREELVARGSATADVDAWLARSGWGEIQELADELRRAPRQ